MAREVTHDVTVTWTCEACGVKHIKERPGLHWYEEPEVPEGWTHIVSIHPSQKVEQVQMEVPLKNPPHPDAKRYIYALQSEKSFVLLLICPECFQKLKMGEIWKRELPKPEEKPVGFWGRLISSLRG